MTKTEYRSEREKRGTQDEVAVMLDIARGTVNGRETGKRPITREAALALKALPKKKAGS